MEWYNNPIRAANNFALGVPLLPPNDDGSQRLPRQYCLIPCDPISPEILQAHEEALVALEMEEEDNPITSKFEEVGEYGLETDWWNLGVIRSCTVLRTLHKVNISLYYEP